MSCLLASAPIAARLALDPTPALGVAIPLCSAAWLVALEGPVLEPPGGLLPSPPPSSSSSSSLPASPLVSDMPVASGLLTMPALEKTTSDSMDIQ